MHSRWKGLSGARIFLAAPMSGFESDEAYRHHRSIVNEACAAFERSGSVDWVYFAGRTIQSVSGFTSADEAFLADYTHLASCDLFVLYYPFRVLSSVLVEVGVAIGLGKPCLLVCRDRGDLVYLLRNAASVSGQYGIPAIRIWEWGNLSISGEILAEKVLSEAELLSEAPTGA
jgi:nucleoside 2-deoxyribosyltransferase